MARARKKPAGGNNRKASGSSRKSRGAAPAAAQVEVVEEEKGLGAMDAAVILTTLTLLIVFVLVDKARGAYGEGMFFKNTELSADSALPTDGN